MIEHPVPQNITAYEFRLIGNMTIKQFVLLGAGGVVGFLIYSTNLPTFIKWPIIVLSVIVGIALAFLPYEERSLDQWLLNFLKAMYRPTKFYWRRIARVPDFFTFVPSPGVMAESQRPDLTPYRTTQVKEFLSSLTPEQIAAPVDQLDLFRQSAAIGALFGQVEAASNVVPGKTQLLRKPALQARPRPLRQKVEKATIATMANAPSAISIFAAAAPGTTTNVLPAAPRVDQAPLPPEEVEVSVPAPRTATAVVVPMEKIVVESTTPTPLATSVAEPSEEGLTAIAAAPYLEAGTEEKISHGEKIIPVVFSKDLPFPASSEKPNLLIGMVHDHERHIAPGAIVEVIDQGNTTVRAMKTNNLGQFYMSSPLKDGEYTIHTEKEGLTFPIYAFSSTGTILDPVDITASG